MKNNIVAFKKKQKFSPEVEEMWSSVKGEVYQKLMPAGISQSLADEFLKKFRPTFVELIFPSFNISLTLPEEESYQKEFESMGAIIKENMNNYSAKVIGMVAYKDLVIFLQRKKLDGEL